MLSEEEIIDYLIDEGYADDDRSALKILEAMSDEWYQEILDEKYVRDYSIGPKKGKGTDGSGSKENQSKREYTLSGGFRSKRGERREGRDSARGGFR